MAIRRLAAIALCVLALTGCLSSPPKVVRNAPCLPPGRILVVARVPSEGNRANAESAAASLVSVLRATSDVIGGPELSAEAGWVGLGVWASSVVGRVQGGGRLTPEEAETLFERFRITTLILSDLSEYDQVWGKYGKFTRAVIDGQAIDVVGDTTEAAVKQWCDARLSVYKRPSSITIDAGTA